MKKFIFIMLWLITIIVGALTFTKFNQNLQYVYGFAVGNVTLIFLMLATDITDKKSR